MREHMRNIEQEFSICQSLYEARTHEIESEEHMRQLAERQNGRLTNELNRLQSEVAKMTGQVNVKMDMDAPLT